MLCCHLISNTAFVYNDVVCFITEEASKKHPFPNPCSYRTALRHYVDINSQPRTHILKDLAEYCSDPAEKDKLLLMSTSSEEGKVCYQS